MSQTLDLGLSNPSVSVGLEDPAYYKTSFPFIDLMKSSQAVLLSSNGKYGVYSNKQLSEGGHLDEHGWLKSLPNGSVRGDIIVVNKFGEAEVSMHGNYVIEWDGLGKLRVGGGGTIVSQEPGRIVVNVEGGNGLRVYIDDPDLNDDGNYIRNITVVKEEFEALHDAGAMFNPYAMDLMNDFRVFRYMDPMDTNGSNQGEWADRPEVSDVTWGTDAGVPVEVLVRLANEAGVDPWFTMPIKATDEYMREFAIYVRDNLDPRLKAHIELSNEVWNGQFGQYHVAKINGETLFEDDAGASFNWYALRASQMSDIWTEVFGDETATRLDRVVATQASTADVSRQILEARSLTAEMPGVYNPSQQFDSLAITSYFGSRGLSWTEMQTQLDTLPREVVVQNVLAAAERSLLGAFENYLNQVVVAQQYGLKLIQYEGGQHVHYFTAGSGQTAAVNNLLAEVVRHPRMGELYDLNQSFWKSLSDLGYETTGPMQFHVIAGVSRYGSWGAYNTLDTGTVRSDSIVRFNEENPAWWDDPRDPDTFLNSQYLIGTGNADTIEGGPKSDVIVGLGGDDRLLGGGGDDSLSGGTGRDTLIGGAGIDTARIAATAGELTVSRVSPTMAKLVTATATTFLTGIERIDFGDTNVAAFAALEGDFAEASERRLDIVRGTAHGDRLVGTAGSDLILGGTGDDTITASAGFDLVVGGDGFDTIDFSAQTVRVGVDLAAGAGTLGIAANSRYASIEGVIGSSANDSLAGSAADERFDGGAGADRMAGRGGNDVYVVDNIGDVVLENADGGRDTVLTALSVYALPANVEDLVFTGTGAFTGTGNDADNRIVGGAGRDSLTGEAGNDTLDGGAGADTLVGGLGDDTFYRDHIGDSIRELAGGGFDTILTTLLTDQIRPHVEKLVFVGTGDFFGKGNWRGDVLVGGAGNDTLEGYSGADTLVGGAGSNRLVGGAGNDVYVVSSHADLVVELEDGGIDWIDALVSGLTLADNVENFRAVGFVGPLEATGNALDNVMLGRAGEDILFGLEGDDSLYGDSGADMLHGGAGNDTLDGGQGIDTLVGGNGDDVYIFDHRDDRAIELAGGGYDIVYTRNTWITLNDNVEEMIYTGTGGTRFTGNGGDNRLVGGDGNDVLYGAAGNDTLVGGLGNDTLAGQLGADVYVFDAGKDRIEGWETGDRIDINLGAAFDSFAEVMAVGRQAGSATLFTFDADTTLTVVGATYAALTSADFLFD